jgi:hypothetical protein
MYAGRISLNLYSRDTHTAAWNPHGRSEAKHDQMQNKEHKICHIPTRHQSNLKCAGTGGQNGSDAYKATPVPALNVEIHLPPIEYIIGSITPSAWEELVSGDKTIR